MGGEPERLGMKLLEGLLVPTFESKRTCNSRDGCSKDSRCLLQPIHSKVEWSFKKILLVAQAFSLCTTVYIPQVQVF